MAFMQYVLSAALIMLFPVSAANRRAPDNTR